MLNKPTRRVFFALWPEHSCQQKIFQSFKLSSVYPTQHIIDEPQAQKPVPRIYKPENLHLTLHFLGNLNQTEFECVEQMASKITLNSFSITLNHYSTFETARVLFMGLAVLPESLIKLHEVLQEGINDCSLKFDERPYTPHVTLMRNINQSWDQINTTPILWPINRFALVESIPDSRGVSYKPVKFYPLLPD